MTRAARPPELAMMHENIDLQRRFDLVQRDAHAPPLRQLASLAPTAGLKNNTARHGRIRTAQDAPVNARHSTYARRA
ncbi:MAG: hypothetical protein ABIZ04_14635 [Opitutus sp.]